MNLSARSVIFNLHRGQFIPVTRNARSHGKGCRVWGSTLASKAAVSLINNGGRLDATLKELGSKDSLRQLATSMVTAGVLSSLGNAITIDGKTLNSVQVSDGFAANVGRNLITGLTRATINSAVAGTDLETSIRTEVVAGILSAASAQGANWIGDQAQNHTLNQFGHVFAHAIAGCMAGAAGASAPGSQTSTASGCGAGAIGAAVGELSAQLYGAADPAKTVAFASMMSGIAAAATGQDAQGVAIASAAGANAAQNNYILHQGTYTKLAQACRQNPHNCTPFTDSNGVTTQPFGQTKNYQILALRNSQGTIVAYQAYNPLTGQTDYTLEPQDLGMFAQMTDFYAGLGKTTPQYALDIALAGGYALQGNNAQISRNMWAGVKDPSYIQAVGESVVLAGLGVLAGPIKIGANSFPRLVETPYGPALQSNAAAALVARIQVEQGVTLYRVGTMGKSQAAEAQFWSLENPNTLDYAQRYGIPAENVQNANFIETAILKPGTTFITRPAPGVGSNVGGGIEVVVPSGGVTMKFFSTK